MKIDRERALKAFKDYAANYDLNNITIRLKINHTYRVASIAERISMSIFNDENNINLAWLLGLLHDIGRFEQITRYATLKDAISIDHAELGADILFRENLFGNFVSDSAQIKSIAENAIRLHNKLSLPENLDTQTLTHAKILRDADKIDIFRVLTEPPYDNRRLTGLSVRPEIMKCVKKHRCVPRPPVSTPPNELESLIAICCMAFEIEYPKSREIIIEQGYLNKLLEQDAEEISIVKSELMNAWINPPN